MSESRRNASRDIKTIASRIKVNESIIKTWLRTNRMKLSVNGVLTEEQYQAVMDHFGSSDISTPSSQSSNEAMANSQNRPTVSNVLTDDRTVLNPNISVQNELTMLNPSAKRPVQQQDPEATILNRDVQLTDKYQTGDIIGNKYKVISSLDNNSGEADLYLCEYQGTNYLAKVYRRHESIKDEVWTILTKIHSPYVVTTIERFSTEGQTVEILPYYKRGSLSSSRLNAQQIKRVVYCVNEGLKALHDVGIIHKDIKPANLIWADNGEDVLIIDFGISSLLDENRTLKFTSTGLTLQYAAPETLHNIFSHYSDYYALGVTVYELFTGTTPYSNMTIEQIEKYYSIQNFPTPEDAPQQIKDLILGTTYFDIRNRKEVDNPNCRWCYDQVKKWYDGESQIVPGQGVGSKFGTIQDYSFHGKKIQTRGELVQSLCANWEEGKEEFISGRLTRHFSQIDNTTGADLAELTAFKRDPDLIFMQALHAIDHGSFAFMWKGRYYQDIKEFAYSAHTALNSRDSKTRNYVEDAMSCHAISEHVKMVYPQRREISDNIRRIEDYFLKQDIQRKERDVYCYVMIYRLIGKYTLIIGEQEFDNIQSLTNHLLQLRLQSSIDFEQFCHELISYGDSLSPQFEAWLIAQGKQKTIREWQKNIALAKE